MNSDNTAAIKKLMETASGGTAGPGDEGWRSEGVERLFLDEFGAEGFVGGLVEVRHGESNSGSVRMELELAPALAARVLALVTKTDLGEMPDLTEPETSAIAECLIHHGTVSAELADAVLSMHPGAIVLVEEQNPFSEQDRRNKEIADLIMSQRKDQEKEEEDKEPTSDDLPEELNFDAPEEKERIPRD